MAARRTDLRSSVPAYYPFGSLDRRVVPAASARPELWAEALRIAAEPLPPGRPATLLHRDFHPGNTLWVGRTLSGIVDWTSSSWGPPAADLAHLRMDVLARTTVRAAVLARDAYARAGGDLTDARHHQLRTLFEYLTDADPFVTAPRTVARLDAFLELVLDEPDGLSD
jgi:aminoglycoside phosphotransferase (APT) family kinase protein